MRFPGVQTGSSSDIGMITNPSNPYQDHSAMFVPPAHEPEGPILTLYDLDRLAARLIADARREWAQGQRRACEKAWEEGRSAGFRDGRKSCVEWVRRNVFMLVEEAYGEMRKLDDGAGVLAPEGWTAEARAAVPRAARALNRAREKFSEMEQRDA